MNEIEIIENYLDELYPNPKCELNYSKDWELLIATVLSAQTTDKRVNSVTNILFNKYPSPEALKDAKENDLEEILRPIGTFRKKTIFIKEIAKTLNEKYNNKVPNNREELIKMPGIGRKTANVVLSNIYSVPAIAVDTHVERVSKRLKIANTNDSVLEVEKRLMKSIKKENWSKIHHQLVLFGRYNCKSRNPECLNCKLKEYCNYKNK